MKEFDIPLDVDLGEDEPSQWLKIEWWLESRFPLWHLKHAGWWVIRNLRKRGRI